MVGLSVLDGQRGVVHLIPFRTQKLRTLPYRTVLHSVGTPVSCPLFYLSRGHMDTVANIEPFLADFFEWYAPFLDRIRGLGLGEKFTDSPSVEVEGSSRIFVIDDRGRYQTQEWSVSGKIRRGTLPAAVELEEELEASFQQLEQDHPCSVTPYFKVLNGFSNPHYNLLVTALEFPAQKDSTQKVAAFLRYEDSLGCFDACYNIQSFFSLFFNIRPVVPGIQMPDLNEKWRGFNHPAGAERGQLIYNV